MMKSPCSYNLNVSKSEFEMSDEISERENALSDDWREKYDACPKLDYSYYSFFRSSRYKDYVNKEKLEKRGEVSLGNFGTIRKLVGLKADTSSTMSVDTLNSANLSQDSVLTSKSSLSKNHREIKLYFGKENSLIVTMFVYYIYIHTFFIHL
jgi:hypothetical protein